MYTKRLKLVPDSGKDCPCYNCEDRKSGCHADCKKYLEWRANLDENRKMIRKEKQANKIYNEFHFNAMNKNTKERRNLFNEE